MIQNAVKKELIKPVKIGVLAVQGSVIEHIKMLKKIDGVIPIEVKTPVDIDYIDGLILPGGESTAIGKLIEDYNIKPSIIKRSNEGMPIWGTCAGMILLAKKILGQEKTYLNLINIAVKRNAYGSQLDSFVAYAVIPLISATPLKLIFIRAPYVISVGENVQILLRVNGKIVAVKQNNIIATSFHPELTDDPSFHQYFVDLVRNA